MQAGVEIAVLVCDELSSGNDKLRLASAYRGPIPIRSPKGSSWSTAALAFFVASVAGFGSSWANAAAVNIPHSTKAASHSVFLVMSGLSTRPAGMAV